MALHAGTHPDEMKEKFKEALEDIGPLEISKIEEELIKEGIPRKGQRKEFSLSLLRETWNNPTTIHNVDRIR